MKKDDFGEYRIATTVHRFLPLDDRLGCGIVAGLSSGLYYHIKSSATRKRVITVAPCSAPSDEGVVKTAGFD